MHIPVLLNEVLKYLDPKPGEFIIDGTVNGGGHSAEIFRRLMPDGKLLGIDLDESRLRNAESRIAPGKSGSGLMLIHGNYADLPEILRDRTLGKADGLLLDLGFSSEQLEASRRGFSFLKDEPLRMTYDESETPVSQVLRELSERDLAKILFAYSGEKFAMRIAKAIKNREKQKPIETTSELRKTILQNVPKGYERGRIDPATRTFQALRIYANKELENLESVLAKLPEILKPGGRAVIISFHSLEDKLVKQKFRGLAGDGKAEILTKKPIEADKAETEQNPRSRSAKLRAVKIVIS